MKRARILIDFTRASDPVLESEAQKIVTAMTGNANFPSPVPTLDKVSDAIQNFSDALAAAKMGDKAKVAIKTDMRNALITMLLNLADYVTATANGDRAMLISSGFKVSKGTRNPRTLGDVNNFRVELGPNSGEALLSVDGVKCVDSYFFQCTLAPATNESNWTPGITSKNTFTFTGLEPLKQYSFRIAVSGSNNQVVYTEVITKTIL